jgi:ABC-2 type transport system ATP-binding protein
MEEAEYCDRVHIQDGGVMLALDTPANIRSRVSEAGATMEDAFIRIVAETRARKQEKAA